MNPTFYFDVALGYADNMRLFLHYHEIDFEAVPMRDAQPEECIRFKVTVKDAEAAYKVGLKYASLLLAAGVEYLVKL